MLSSQGCLQVGISLALIEYREGHHDLARNSRLVTEKSGTAYRKMDYYEINTVIIPINFTISCHCHEKVETLFPRSREVILDPDPVMGRLRSEASHAWYPWPDLGVSVDPRPWWPKTPEYQGPPQVQYRSERFNTSTLRSVMSCEGLS